MSTPADAIAGEEVIAYITEVYGVPIYLYNRRTKKLHSTRPLERCNTDAARRAGNLKEITKEDDPRIAAGSWCKYCS